MEVKYIEFFCVKKKVKRSLTVNRIPYLLGLLAVLFTRKAARFSLKNSTMSDCKRDFLFPVQAAENSLIKYRKMARDHVDIFTYLPLLLEDGKQV